MPRAYLPWTRPICLLTVILISQAVFLLEHGHIFNFVTALYACCIDTETVEQT